MAAWSASFFLFFTSIYLFSEQLGNLTRSLGVGREVAKLKKVESLLLEIEETLVAGMVPKSDRWFSISKLSQPWGALVFESLENLRIHGGALLPTIRRFQALVRDHSASLSDAKARSAQAIAQAAVCALLVPIFGACLYTLLPSIEEHRVAWLVICAIALAVSGLGAAWMLNLAQSARWGGLRPEQRSWLLISYCAGEKFLALVRSGAPPDLAWQKTTEQASKDAPELALEWGFSIWEQPDEKNHLKTGMAKTGLAAKAILGAGNSVRKAVQVSVMEGKACTDRVEAIFLSLRQEMKAQVDKEISLLSTRNLQPLFFCVAPSLFGILAAGLYLSWLEAV